MFSAFLHVPFVLWLGASTFDSATTIYKMRQGCREANPVLTSLHITTPMRIAVYKGGFAVGMAWQWGRREKPSRVLTTTTLILAGAQTAAGVWNLHQACQKTP